MNWENGMTVRAAVTLATCLSLGACAYHSGFDRAPGAPVLEPSASAEVLKADPPADAVLLGTVHAMGNNLQQASSCDAQLVNEARKLGANAVRTYPASSSLGRGPKCEGKAYLIKSR
jgi:hypothetical protein